MGAREDKLLWYSYHKPNMFESFIYDWSSPHDKSLLCKIAIAPQVIWITRKTTKRKTNIFLDRWYMACKRVIMITCVMFQSSQYHWDTVTEQLTAEHRIYDDGCPVRHKVDGSAWRMQLVISNGRLSVEWTYSCYRRDIESTTDQ
jgi:hypothetical protein